MGKRLFDVFFSFVAFVTLVPVFVFATVGIKLNSKGAVFYKAHRVGRNRNEFSMLKFRTMHVNQDHCSSSITSHNDPRIFAFGLLLRFLKIDELPQLINILKGDMSIVGPRPEDSAIVRKHYTEEQMETLNVRPGLASPGSIYNYTHGEQLLDKENAEEVYAVKLLPLKLALDTLYVRNASIVYDILIIIRTLYVIVMKMFGRIDFPDPPEMADAQKIVYR